MTPQPAAAMPPTAAGSRPHCTGSCAEHALDAEVRLYDHLFTKENPDEVEEGQGLYGESEPGFAEGCEDCKVEPSVKDARPLDRLPVRAPGLFLRGSGQHAAES